MVAVPGADDGMAGVEVRIGGVTLAGVHQGVGQLRHVLSVLVVVTQVQLDALGTFLLGIADGRHGIVDGWLKGLPHAVRQNHVDVQVYYLLLLFRNHRCRVVVVIAFAGGEGNYADDDV